MLDLQAKAEEKFRRIGLPNRKMGAYQYLRISKLPELDALAGHLPTSPSEYAMPLSSAMPLYGQLLKGRMHALVDKSGDPITLLNFSRTDDGLFFYVPPGKTISEPVVIKTEATSRIHIVVGKGSSVSFIHKGEGSVANTFIDLACETNAHVKFYNDVRCESGDWRFDKVHATLKRDASLDIYSYTPGGAGVRDDYHVELLETNSEVRLTGLADLAEGNESHTHIFVHHKAPGCRSHQDFKKVVANGARSSFEGKIYVDPIAQQTEAYQLNQNLLLGSQAIANSKPNLEIFADDVKASHGCTVAQLDDGELFYLQTRGLTREQAKEYLQFAFTSSFFNGLPSKFRTYVTEN
ncbi:MAG: SufD family Fe-S cluster assembly protein [Simkaniaceae bacterium]|nr:SufD family Fe-S cluster assembly protein [Simkaniaceae bacterium]